MYWPNISNDITSYVRSCTCAEFSYAQQKQPLQLSIVPPRPWSRIAVDLFTFEVGLSPSKKNLFASMIALQK